MRHRRIRTSEIKRYSQRRGVMPIHTVRYPLDINLYWKEREIQKRLGELRADLDKDNPNWGYAAFVLISIGLIGYYFYRIFT